MKLECELKKQKGRRCGQMESRQEPTWLNVQCKCAFQYESVTGGSHITGFDGNAAYRREVDKSTAADKLQKDRMQRDRVTRHSWTDRLYLGNNDHLV